MILYSRMARSKGFAPSLRAQAQAGIASVWHRPHRAWFSIHTCLPIGKPAGASTLEAAVEVNSHAPPAREPVAPPGHPDPGDLGFGWNAVEFTNLIHLGANSFHRRVHALSGGPVPGVGTGRRAEPVTGCVTRPQTASRRLRRNPAGRAVWGGHFSSGHAGHGSGLAPSPCGMRARSNSRLMR